MTLQRPPADEKQFVNEVVHETQDHELIHAYRAAKTLVETLEVVGLTDEAKAAKASRRRIYSHMSGEAYVSYTGRLVRP